MPDFFQFAPSNPCICSRRYNKKKCRSCSSCCHAGHTPSAQQGDTSQILGLIRNLLSLAMQENTLSGSYNAKHICLWSGLDSPPPTSFLWIPLCTGDFSMVLLSKWIQNYLGNCFRSPFENGFLDDFTVFPLPDMDILINAAVAQEPPLMFSECREGGIARTLIVWGQNKILSTSFYTGTRQPRTTHWFEDAPLYLPGCFTLQAYAPSVFPICFWSF